VLLRSNVQVILKCSVLQTLAAVFRPPKLTQPQPFRLQTEARGVLHEREMAAKVAADEAKAKRMRRVTACPLPVTLDIPVVPPKPEAKPLTLPDPFPLKSMVSMQASQAYALSDTFIAPVYINCLLGHTLTCWLGPVQ
jgi:hypothetical protein